MDQTTAVAVREGNLYPPAEIIGAAEKLPKRDLIEAADLIRRVAISSSEMARQCIWCRTVGKRDGKDQFKIGPSIRLAEIGLQAFQYIWIHTDITEDAKSVTAYTVAFDLKGCIRVNSDETKSIITKAGNRFSDSQVAVTRAAVSSLSRRNALLQLMRPQLEAIMDDVKKRIIMGICPEGTSEEESSNAAWAMLVEDFSEFGVTEEQLKDAAKSEKTRLSKLVVLIGILNAVNDGAVKIGDVFAINENSKSKPKMTEPTAAEPAKAAPIIAAPDPAPAQTAPEAPKPAQPVEAPKTTPAPTIQASAGSRDLKTVQFEVSVAEMIGFLKTSPEDIAAALMRSAGVADLKTVPVDKRNAVFAELNKLADVCAEAEGNSHGQ